MKNKLSLTEDFLPGEEEAADMLGYDPDAEPTLEDQGWEYVASKDVYDEDGFRDVYYWYRKDGNNRFFFSSDVDYGDPEYFDWETDGEEAAQEWFDSYGEDEYDLKEDTHNLNESESTDNDTLDDIAARLERVNGPRYRGARKPTYNADAINESEFPDNMRAKRYAAQVTQDGRIAFSWVTQEPFTETDADIFKEELDRYFTRIVDNSNYEGPIYVDVTVSCRDGDEWGHSEFTLSHPDDQFEESFNDTGKSTKEDILEYAKLHGDRSAADLLLLGGYEFFDGTADEYDALLKELEGKADGEKVDESLTEDADTQIENSVASRLIEAINDEWKTIDLYNSIISELSTTDGDDYKKMIPVIEDIVNEENVHVGQLQKALELISPDTADIAKGEKEAEGQIGGGDPSDDKKALVDESCDKSIDESTGHENKNHIELALSDGSLDKDTFIDYILEHTPDDMLAGVVDLIMESDNLNEALDNTDTQSTELAESFDDDYDDFELAGIYGGDMIYCPICGRRLEYTEDGDQVCPKCKKSAWDLAQERRKRDKNESIDSSDDLSDEEMNEACSSKIDAEESLDECDYGNLEDDPAVDVSDLRAPADPHEKEKLQEFGPAAAAIVSAVAPVVADKVLDKILPENAPATTADETEVQGAGEEDDIDESVLNTL